MSVIAVVLGALGLHGPTVALAHADHPGHASDGQRGGVLGGAAGHTGGQHATEAVVHGLVAPVHAVIVDAHAVLAKEDAGTDVSEGGAHAEHHVAMHTRACTGAGTRTLAADLDHAGSTERSVAIADNAATAHDAGISTHIHVHQHGGVPHITVVRQNAVAGKVGVIQARHHTDAAGHRRGLDEQTDEDVAIEVAAADFVQRGVEGDPGGAQQLDAAPVGRPVSLGLQQEDLIGS